MTNKWVAALVIALASATAIAPASVEAKRLGGGRAAGMQRSLPAKPAPDTLPARPGQQQAAPAQAAAPAAAAAPRRSWMGPIAGIAAGLGIAALMSHLGLGEGMGNILTMLLLAGAAVFLVRFLMRRFGSNAGAPKTPASSYAFQGAGADAGRTGGAQVAWPAAGGSAAAVAPVASAEAATLPAGFDAPGFERIAKMIFIRMQAANDTADLADLREFTTPELFASLRVDLQDRKEQPQQTDVLKVDAQVLEVTQEPGRQVVSVRFSGLVREERDSSATDFDEVWHLVKPDDGSRNWAIAGIQQAQLAQLAH